MQSRRLGAGVAAGAESSEWGATTCGNWGAGGGQDDAVAADGPVGDGKH